MSGALLGDGTGRRRHRAGQRPAGTGRRAGPTLGRGGDWVTAITLVGFGLTAVVVLVLLRGARPELATLLVMAAAAVIFAAILPDVLDIVRLLRQLASQGGVQPAYLGAVLRIVGVAYLTEFGAQVARDAGEGAVAGKVELGGKVLVLTMALPILLGILQMVLRLAA